MVHQASLTDRAELYARKLQASSLLATLARIKLTGEVSADDSAALTQGVELLKHLVNGRLLFANEAATRQLVAEGIAFLAAARALRCEPRENLEACSKTLGDMQATLVAIKELRQAPEESTKQLEEFLAEFTKVLQTDINVDRIGRHALPT